MAKCGSAAKNAKSAKSEIVTGNLSKARRDELTAKIGEIKAFLEKSSDRNAVRLLRFAAEVEREVRDKKFGLVFEEHRERVDVELEENLPVLTEVKTKCLAAKNAKVAKNGELPLNFIIEGDNLAALKLLEKTHRGKIDVIYIDPPYNTGNKDFIYNDSYVDKTDTFRHSKWLSFMKKRLEIARRLMSDKGVIFISIDDNEQAALKLLCDEVFGPDNFESTICRITTRRIKGDARNINSIHDYVLAYAKTNAFKVRHKPKQDFGIYDLSDEYETSRGKHLIRPLDNGNINYSKNGDYEISAPDGSIIVAGGDPVERQRRLKGKHKTKDWCFRWGLEKFKWGLKNDYIVFKKTKEGRWRCYFKIYQFVDNDLNPTMKYDNYTSVIDEAYNNQGTSELKNILATQTIFNYPKPLKMMEELIGMVGVDAVILDYFAGSGTTGHAVMKLNAEDGGKRKFILVTNNENGICEKVTYERLKRVMKKEKYAARLKYLKIGYVPIKDKVYYEYADDLLKHIRELVELENAIDFKTDSSIAIAVTDKEFEKFMSNEKKMGGQKALYVGHDVLIGKSARQKLERRGIKVRIIPQYYYSEQEA